VDRTLADPMIGRVLDGRYRVGARIARGGMATVYEATDLRLDRPCALKVMHAGLGDDDDFAGRFVREARAAARLSHPHVVNVFDQGDDDGILFLAMEHVPGHTLRDVVRRDAPLPADRALELIEPVLSALGAAHASGLIHRDVKPENVLIADDGRVKVADFGLSRAISAETQHTHAGVLIGTVSYLAPELLVEGHADARSDVYAVGVVLFELLTGRKPHEGDSPIQVAFKHVNEDVPPPSRLVPGVPAYVDALVARATARDRDLRPADARVLLHQVHRVRAALADGVLDDPDLTEDLSPTVPVQRIAGRGADDIDYVREDPTPTPAEGLTGDEADTSVIRTPQRTRRAAPPQSTRRSRRGPLLLVLVLLLALAAGGGAWWFGAGRYTSTPGVVRLTSAAARAQLESAGLGYRVEGRAWSETVPVGSVVRTDPAGGENVVRGGTVGAVLSRGPERHDVPVLAGRTLEDAQAALTGARLATGVTTYAFSATVPRDTVIRSSPEAGASRRRDTAVDLVVSRGPRPVKVPDLTGTDAEAAGKVLDRLRLKGKVTEENSDTVDKGHVVSQTPAAGRLLPGATVELVVSKGPVLVEVPGVVKQSSGQAAADLEAAGFAVRVERASYYIGLDIVVGQSVGGGDKAPKGSTVTITVV
jgi:serine/threonine protein kinase/beta-lactam-binding protein with PASTA domain